MKNVTITILSIPLVTMFFVSSVGGQVATWDDASTVAVAWVEQIIQNKGHWGGSDGAYVYDIQEFKRGDRVVGYYCEVKPTGFILVSLRKELAPIKVYSAESNLDPESEEGMAKILKMKMEGILNAIEEPIHLYGADADPHIQAPLEIDYRPVWNELCGQIALFNENPSFGPIPLNYQGGQVLLTSAWDQDWPYNAHCPHMGCSPSLNGRAWAGCTAIAGAQTMRYWNWPPRGQDGSPWDDSYDWVNMPDHLSSMFSSETQIDAVAELIHEVGVASDMNYDCSGSGACSGDCFGDDLRDAFEEHFRYLIASDNEYRDDFSADAWFNLIKWQLGMNRPLPYSIYFPQDDEGHAIVVDGWQIVGSTKQYHMNWGWGPWSGRNSWYTLDAIPGTDPEEDEVVMSIRPKPAMGTDISGIYPKTSFPYRYFDQDAVGDFVTFYAGQNLQFLPGVTLRCENTLSGFIQFLGASTGNTRLFSIKGGPDGGIEAGIRIYSGKMILHPGGSIRFH